MGDDATKYALYEQKKRVIKEMDLTPEEYELLIRKLVKELRI